LYSGSPGHKRAQMKKLTFPVAAAAAAAVWTCVFAFGHAGCSDKNPAEDPDGSGVAADTGTAPACKPNLSCSSNLECGTGQCQGGKCKCGGGTACYSDAECSGTTKCCNLVTNQCYQCDVDGGASDAPVSTDTTTTPDTGGGDPGAKDTGGGNDEPQACTSDFQCPDLDKSHCNTAIGLCVQCYQDGHCPGSTCNMTTFTCEGGFDAGTNDTGTQDTGVVPDAGDACSGYSCLCDSYCMVQGGTPTCVSGCRNVGDCCAGHDCVNGSCVSTTCGTDADCSGATPHCAPSGECKECVYDSHCANGFYCDQMSYTCQIIVDNCNPPCDPATEYCDTMTLTCQPKIQGMCQTCASLIDCIAGGMICGTITKKCTKQCTLDSDCMGYTCGIMGFCSCP